MLTDTGTLVAAGPFDLIVCSKVREYMADPRQVLRLFKANAAPGNLLAITVPSARRRT